MKKLISLLTATAVIAPIGAQIVSCTNTSFEGIIPALNIGKNIDKSKAIDDSIEGKFGFTNFYVVGDSLSDTNGISTLVKEKFANSLIDIDLSLEGNYGFYDEDIQAHVSAFTNGAPAGYRLSKMLNAGAMTSSNWNSKDTPNYGKNYSVGGATAAKLSLPTGILLNDATVDRQTEALVKQHVIKDRDLVYFEIGGNDLFSLIDLQNNPARQVEFMQDSIARTRIALFNLLNNGVKQIIFMTPPKMDFVPMYQDVFENINQSQENAEKAEHILNICEEYYNQLTDLLKEVDTYYPDSITMYDLYHQTEELENSWKATLSPTTKPVLRTPYVNKTEYKILLNEQKFTYQFSPNTTTVSNLLPILNELKTKINFLGKNNLSITIEATRESEVKANIDDYFFTDFVHPTKKVHELVGNILFDLAEEISKKWRN